MRAAVSPVTSTAAHNLHKEKEKFKHALPIPTRVSIPNSSQRMLRRRSMMSLIFGRRRSKTDDDDVKATSGASVYHALVVIFLEYFAWGLLTVPVINVLAETFPTNKFLMNGLVLGIKGLLSFLSAPLVGALSDVWGRKIFLVLTVFCTCMPIPCLKISPWWYFSLFSISGLFSVTFSVVLAYVADITDKHDRSAAYGLVSATFAASLVSSPALGAWMSEAYSDGAVVALATIVSIIDVLFILWFVPESLPTKRNASDVLSWQVADPFGTLRYVWEDRLVLKLALIVFLSYLPESGQFSCFFVYLKLIVGFTPEAVATYIGMVGILSVIAQTGILQMLTHRFGTKGTITMGLCFQLAQLTWYGLSTQYWMMWSAGVLAAISSIIYPAISSFISILSDKDKQGTVQGVVTGIRGLCQGFGPALFGLVFYIFDVDLDTDEPGHVGAGPFPPIRIRPADGKKILAPRRNETISLDRLPAFDWQLIPGPPFLVGAMLVLCALLVNSALPSSPPTASTRYLRREHSRQSSDTARLITSDAAPHL